MTLDAHSVSMCEAFLFGYNHARHAADKAIGARGLKLHSANRLSRDPKKSSGARIRHIFSPGQSQ